jgi:FkbM family methyltransferase
MRCDLSSYIEWNIYLRGSYDSGIASVVKQLVRPGMRVVDVGANVGSYTLLIAKRVGPGGRVAAFEPNPEVYDRLLANLQLNSLDDRVELFRCALSEQPGTAKLYLPRSGYRNRGIASLVHYSDSQDRTIEVSLARLDDAIAHWERVDIIKVDTDGHDYGVLMGAKGLIERHRPTVLFEFERDSWPEAEARVVSLQRWFATLDYRLYSISGTLAAMRPITRGVPNGNLAVIPKEGVKP